MDSALDLPQYIIDLEHLHREVAYGDITPTLTKANGRVVKMSVKTTRSLRFRENRDALLYVVDQLKSIAQDKSGKLTFEFHFSAGRINGVATTTEEKKSYA